MGRFVRILHNLETQAETVGLSGELNSNIMLGRVKQNLPEEHRIAYYKSVRDDHTGETLSGLVKWLYSLELLLEKAKPAGQGTVPPPAPHKSLKSMNATSVDRTNTTHNLGQLKCALHSNTSSHFLKNCKTNSKVYRRGRSLVSPRINKKQCNSSHLYYNMFLHHYLTTTPPLN